MTQGWPSASPLFVQVSGRFLAGVTRVTQGLPTKDKEGAACSSWVRLTERRRSRCAARPWGGCAELQEEHASPGAPLAVRLNVQGRSERVGLLVRCRGEGAGHFEVAARFGAAGVDEDAPGGEGGLEALEAVGE